MYSIAYPSKRDKRRYTIHSLAILTKEISTVHHAIHSITILAKEISLAILAKEISLAILTKEISTGTPYMHSLAYPSNSIAQPKEHIA